MTEVDPVSWTGNLSDEGDLAIFEDDKTYLTMRVDRLETGMAWAEDPPSHTRHVVGNLVVHPMPGGTTNTRGNYRVDTPDP